RATLAAVPAPTDSPPGDDRRRTALVVAHPGHELTVYHWVERHRPLCFCLTDGSGGGATSRIASTNHLLNHLGATTRPIYGRYADRDVYRRLLDRRLDAFLGLAQELAAALAEARVDCVAGDAAEGFNPAHDVCRFLVDGAIAMVRRQTGRVLQNYDFALDTAPGTCPAPLRATALWLRLDDAAMERKL